ncbi:hypothetical protein [Brumimicrobium mesophilum]|uniref:hypothetical protein n=1 Tax=Brumimicrobium mesophilum TaxID=392717 RepID=UPI000D14154E|nr:hypothetical protein [Brumimicrobium mesophilum]
MEYDKWNPEKWETAFSEIEWLFMESLIDNKSILTILLTDNKDNLFEVTFNNYPAYRNILEEYRLNLWGIRDEKWPNLGNAWIVKNSDWLTDLTESEPLLNHHEGKLNHFIICTQDDVIEILSNESNPMVKINRKSFKKTANNI